MTFCSVSQSSPQLLTYPPLPHGACVRACVQFRVITRVRLHRSTDAARSGIGGGSEGGSFSPRESKTFIRDTSQRLSASDESEEEGDGLVPLCPFPLRCAHRHSHVTKTLMGADDCWAMGPHTPPLC